MALPKFEIIGIKKMKGFEAIVIQSCDETQLAFEIYGSPSFIRQAQAQLLLGATTATMDMQLVRLYGVQSIVGNDPETVIILAKYESIGG